MRVSIELNDNLETQQRHVEPGHVFRAPESTGFFERVSTFLLGTLQSALVLTSGLVTMYISWIFELTAAQVLLGAYVMTMVAVLVAPNTRKVIQSIATSFFAGTRRPSRASDE